MPSLGGPCWFCGGEKVCHQYAFTYACPKCGGTGLQVDAERREREQDEWEKRRATEHALAIAELRELREKA